MGETETARWKVERRTEIDKRQIGFSYRDIMVDTETYSTGAK